MIPKLGVYSVDVGLKGSKGFYKGIANVGYRPTFGVNDINLEVNIFGFNQICIIRILEYYLKNLLDLEKNLKNINELKSQIIKDLKKDLTKNVKRGPYRYSKTSFSMKANLPK